MNTDKSESIREKVREGYGAIARESGACGSTSRAGDASGGSCCGGSPAHTGKLAAQIGYSVEELEALPEGANLGLSCGNPNVLAALQPGEVVLDLGSGGGFDVFIAGKKVGPTGRVIGVDMTPDMLSKARKNIAAYRARTGMDNVEFRLGEIEHLPVADNSVDALISNCVINLSPDKPQVWREIARVLKPGGRVAVSDLALLQPLPPNIAGMIESLIGCVAGAVLVSETEHLAREAGLTGIKLTTHTEFVRAMTDWNDPLFRKIVDNLPEGAKPEDFVTSLEITARKPASAGKAEHSSKAQPQPECAPKLEIYDPAMCCSSGVCGPEVDPKLVQFAAEIKWLEAQGVEVRRFNLSQSPAAFAENETVRQALTDKGESTLPVILVNDELKITGRYPDRQELAALLGLPTESPPAIQTGGGGG